MNAAPPEDRSVASAVSRGLAAAAILMVAATFLSRITGLLRAMVYARVFGLNPEFGVFVQAFRIPDLVYFLMAGGALRTGFVPVFSEYLAHGKREAAWRTFSVLLWVLLIFAVFLVGAGMIFAVPLARLVAPGFGEPEIAACARMMRVLFPAELFFVVGGLLQGSLNAHKHFLWPAVGPIVYNCFMIAGAIAAPYLWGIDTVTYSVVVGAIFSGVLLQIAPLRRFGARVYRVLDLSDDGFRRVIKLALPVIFGLAIAEIVWVIISSLSTMVAGERGAAIMENANRLWKLPSGTFGAGVAIALFPTLAEKYALNDHRGYVRDFSFGMRNTIFLTLPAILILGLLRVPLVRLLLEGGKFGPQDTAAVAEVLLWLTPGMLALSIVYILTRAFYARHDAMTPVWAGLASVAVCVGVAWPAMRLGMAGLGMATSASSVANVILLMVLLRQKVGLLDGKRILLSFVRSLPANLFLSACCLILPPLVDRFVGTGGMGRLLAVVLPLSVGMLGFIAIAAASGVEELRTAW
ncbi:MAG: murein biosynthesis integral membrane protein MurJ, partial [Armatimonadetes bacterium]|nr:murein biosynthesis integral membrane protein MurJ [Armatimonadota bacterium]